MELQKNYDETFDRAPFISKVKYPVFNRISDESKDLLSIIIYSCHFPFFHKTFHMLTYLITLSFERNGFLLLTGEDNRRTSVSGRDVGGRLGRGHAKHS